MKETSIFQMKYRYIKAEKGAILPISLFLLFLFSLVTVHAATKYEIEKQSFHHIEETYTLEILLLMAYRDVEEIYADSPDENGQIQYENGFVNYELIEETESYFNIYFQCYSENKELFTTLKLPKQ